MALITLTGLSFSYATHPVLNNVSLSILPGQRLVILGGNGSGKTTLAHLLAGWLNDDQPGPGAMTTGGRSWSELSLTERVTTVQFVGQIPMRHLSGRAFSVREEIAFGLENLNLPVSRIRQRVDSVLESCRLDALAERNPFTLSGGEQQRLLIACALALQPAILVLDEPLTNLDPEARTLLVTVLRALPPETTIIQFETNPDYALHTGDSFAFLHDGRIVREGGARDVLFDPLLAGVLGLPSVTAAWLEASPQRAQADPQTWPLRIKDFHAIRGSAA
jgi:energy-coupling factor transporter ATP-binding protein EcfA2